MLITISLAQILKVKPVKASGFLAVKPGDKIKKGDLIASKKNILGKKS